MVGGALLVAAEMRPAQTDLFIAAYIIQLAALALLLMATIGFLGMIGQHTYSDIPRVSIAFRIIGLLALAALGIIVAGGILGTHIAPQSGHIGLTLRRIGVAIFGGVYVLLVLVHIGAWTYRWHLRHYRRHLLYGISTATPFLGVCVAYSFLSAWSSSDLFGINLSPNPTIARFNPVTGQWIIYLVMSVIMEYVTVLIFIVSSTWLSQRRH